MKPLYCILFLLVVVNDFNIFAQNTPTNFEQNDTLISLAKNAYALASTNSDSGIALSKQVLKLAQQKDNNLAIASAYNALAWNYYKKGNADSSIFYYKKSITTVNKIGDPLLISRINCNLASVLTSQSKYEEALEYLLIADSYAITSKNKSVQANVKRQEAMLFRVQKNNEKAIVKFGEAMSLSLSDNDTLNFINAGINLGILYNDIKHYDSSLSVLYKCLDFALKIDKAETQLNGIYEHLGGTYFAKEEYSQALNYYSKSYENHKKAGSFNDIAYLGYKIGITFNAVKNYTKAENYLLQSYQIADSLNLSNYQYEIALSLASVLHHSHKWKQAYSYLKIATNIKDSLNLDEQLNRVADLQAKYESDKKEQQITLLTTEKKYSRLISFITLISAILVTVVAYFWINKIRLQRRLREQNIRTKIAGDLHDDIGSALSSISMITQMVSDKLEIENNKHAALLRKAENNAKSIIENMDDIVWSINPKNDEFKNLELKIKEYVFALMESKNINIEMNFEKGIEDLKLNMEQRRDLYLILKEAFNNIAKYSNANDAYLNIIQKNKIISIAIEDNGSGFDIHNNTHTSGNGIKNMYQRAAQLNAHINIESKIGSGTKITLLFEK